MTDSSNKSLAWAPIALSALLLGLGTWVAFGNAGHQTTNVASITNVASSSGIHVDGPQLSYRAKTGVTYELTTSAGWDLTSDSAGTRVVSSTGEELDLSIQKKAASQSLADYVASQTYASPVGEGSFDTPQGLSVNGIPAIRITGSYAAPLVSYFFLLSDTEVLTAGGTYDSAAQLSDIDALATALLSDSPPGALKTYSDPKHGFSVDYPSDWSAHTLSSAVTGLGPLDKTYYLEGDVAYPVQIATDPRSAEAYLSNTPSSRKTAVTVNGNTGFKVLNYGDKDYFYIFTIKNGESVSITAGLGPVVSEPSIQDQFMAILNSLRLD